LGALESPLLPCPSLAHEIFVVQADYICIS
jgi:hypothetical protein